MGYYVRGRLWGRKLSYKWSLYLWVLLKTKYSHRPWEKEQKAQQQQSMTEGIRQHWSKQKSRKHETQDIKASWSCIYTDNTEQNTRGNSSYQEASVWEMHTVTKPCRITRTRHWKELSNVNLAITKSQITLRQEDSCTLTKMKETMKVIKHRYINKTGNTVWEIE